MTEVMDAKAIIIGSPTLNNQMFPTISDFLTYMKVLKPKNKMGSGLMRNIRDEMDVRC